MVGSPPLGDAAVLVCDMWDTHWCPTLAAGTAALAFHVDGFLRDARGAGAVVIHAPSQTDPYYRTWPQYQRAAALARPRPTDGVRPPVPRLTFDIPSSCPCDPPCPPPDESGGGWPYPWRRQHDRIAIDDDDYVVCDDGDRVYGILRHHKRGRLLVCGVHTNACAVDRPFGLRAMWSAGVDVALVRDLTEATRPDRTRDAVRVIAERFAVVDSWDLTGGPP